MFGITRVDQSSKRTHFWLVRFWGGKNGAKRKPVIQKCFSDLKYGGKDKALEAAMVFRDEYLSQKGGLCWKDRNEGMKELPKKQEQPGQIVVTCANDSLKLKNWWSSSWVTGGFGVMRVPVSGSQLHNFNYNNWERLKYGARSHKREVTSVGDGERDYVEEVIITKEAGKETSAEDLVNRITFGLLEEKELGEELMKFKIVSEEGEEWKHVKEYGGRFLVSSYGRIVSIYEMSHFFSGSKMLQNGERIPLGHEVKKIYKIKERKVNIIYELDKVRGSKIQFQDPITRKKTNFSIAQVVAKYFLPNPGNAQRLIWKDFNITNYRIENLKWKGGGIGFHNKEEYIQWLKDMDVGERKSEDITNAIIEYLDGDNQKMEEILGRNRTKIYWKVFNIVKCPGTADDLTQESALKIYQKINEFKFWYPKNPVGWFIRIAQNLARNYVAKVSKVKMISLDFERFEDRREGEDFDYEEEGNNDFDWGGFLESNRSIERRRNYYGDGE